MTDLSPITWFLMGSLSALAVVLCIAWALVSQFQHEANVGELDSTMRGDDEPTVWPADAPTHGVGECHRRAA